MTLGCFQLFAVTNDTLMNFMIVHIHISILVRAFLEQYIFGSRIAWTRVMHMEKKILQVLASCLPKAVSIYSLYPLKSFWCQVIEKSAQSAVRKFNGPCTKRSRGDLFSGMVGYRLRNDVIWLYFSLLASQLHFLFGGSLSDKSPLMGLKQLWRGDRLVQLVRARC